MENGKNMYKEQEVIKLRKKEKIDRFVNVIEI